MSDQEPDLDTDLEEIEYPILRLLKEYGQPRKGLLIAGVFGGMFGFLISLIPPTLFGTAIDTVFGSKALSLPLIPDSLIPEAQLGQFHLIIGLIVASYLSEGVLNWIRGYGLNAFAQKIQHDVRVDTYDAMQRLNMDFFENNSSGELMSVLNNDVNNLEEFLSGGATVFVRIVFTMLGISIILFSINWQMAFVSLIAAPMIAVFTYWFVRTVQPIYSDVRDSVGKLNSLLENNLGGIKVIKASTMEKFEREEVEKMSKQYFDTNWRAIKTRIKFYPGMRILAGTGFILTFIVGGYWVINDQAPFFFTGTLSVGEFVTFMLLTQEFIWPMANFGDFVNMYQEAYASAERVFGLMDQSQREEEDDDKPDLQVSEGVVEYDSVTFGYDEEPVVEDLNFTIGSKETLALAGPTGAGKSTVVKLLLRFYNIDEGEIRVDNQNILDVNLKSLRSSIGYVSQDNVLFPESVEENIAYAVPDASREKVVEAAKKAQAHEFIQELPEGYDSEVGEDGVKLSGGQRQRIGIARAILQDPEILILDEATSDVDTETEIKIQKGIEELIQDRTVLAIAHRLSTIKDADQIIVLDDGRIVERGSHDELLEEDGIYAKLWKVQAGQTEDVSDYFLEEGE
ncbi:MAG: ABC transporter ATP-binding protein [Candidatus Nanohaloarchaea archaeon]